MLFEQNVLTITLLLFSCQLTQSSGYIRKYIFLMFLRDIGILEIEFGGALTCLF